MSGFFCAGCEVCTPSNAKVPLSEYQRMKAALETTAQNLRSLADSRNVRTYDAWLAEVEKALA